MNMITTQHRDLFGREKKQVQQVICHDGADTGGQDKEQCPLLMLLVEAENRWIRLPLVLVGARAIWPL